jgi:ABC-type antimicrobial peptide transport system permease subunit
MERRAEFALMLAVGMARSKVAYWMVAETHLGAVVGAIIGASAGAAIAVAERSSVSWSSLAFGTFAIIVCSSISCLLVSVSFDHGSLVKALRAE